MRAEARLVALAALVGALSAGCQQRKAGLPSLLQPRHDKSLAFVDPAQCKGCHAQHYAEWRMTPHAYALMDPVFNAMVRLGQAQSKGKLGQFCVQCHTPTGLATGQTQVYFDEDQGMFAQHLDVGDIAKTGVTCTACHSITDVIEPVDARVVYTPNGVLRGPISDPVDNDAHASRGSELFTDATGATARLCGSCHSVTSPKGSLIEQTFTEFDASGSKAAGKSCVSCHMPEYQGKAAVGPDAPDGVPTRTVHRHSFIGVDVSLLPPDQFPGFEQMRALSASLLRGSAELTASFDPDGRSLEVSVRNLAGHGLPSGATAERQMWLEVLVRDSNGNVVFESGTLDANGDLRDGVDSHNLEPGTDPQLAYYGQQLVAIDGFDDMTDVEKAAARKRADSECRPEAEGGVVAGGSIHPVTMPWQAHWQCDTFLAPDQTDHHPYDLSALPPGTYNARVRLLFRTFPPYFLRQLEDQAGLDPAVETRVPITEMATTNVALSL